jgi:hypothetical protein
MGTRRTGGRKSVPRRVAPFAMAAVVLLAAIVVAILIPPEPIGHADGPSGPVIIYDYQVGLRVVTVVTGFALAALLAFLAWRAHAHRDKAAQRLTSERGAET